MSVIVAVIQPVFKAEDVKRYFPRAKRLLIKELNAITIADSKRLNDLLLQYESLSVVYEYRKKLEAICKTKKASFEEVYVALQAWCNHAEATGIADLEHFAAWLKHSLMQSRWLCSTPDF